VTRRVGGDVPPAEEAVRAYGAEGRRLRELKRENTELKKTLAVEMLKNRVLSYECEKSCEPGCAPGISQRSGESNAVLATGGVPKT
jgi:hypothetical protein